MDIATRHERQRILKQIDRLEVERCGDCAGYTAYHLAVKCECPAAVEIRALGDALIATSARSRQERIDACVRQAKKNGLTIEIYTTLREHDLTNIDVQKAVGMTKNEYHLWRIAVGLKTPPKPAARAPKTIIKPPLKVTPYVEPDYYQIAADNGVSKQILENRVFDLKWDLQKAMTTPVDGEEKTFKEWRETAIQNGINPHTFKKRVYDGESMEGAATRPTHQRAKETKYSKELVAIAESNGVTYRSFTQRITKMGWSPEKAATTPPLRGKYKREDTAPATPKKERASISSKYGDDILAKAKSNGISYATFVRRVTAYGWSYHRAATEAARKMNREKVRE